MCLICVPGYRANANSQTNLLQKEKIAFAVCDNNKLARLRALVNDSNENYKVVSKRAIGENRLVTKVVMPNSKAEKRARLLCVFPISIL